MGNGPTHNSIMSRNCWTVALWLSSMLDDAERDAVIGDLAESREKGSRALVNVLGLVVRRQATFWKNSHFWAVLLIMVLPLSFLLCTVAQGVAGETAVYTWMYANNWDWELFKNFGFWYEMWHVAIQTFLAWLMLACWSWSAGFLLGCYRKVAQPQTSGALLLLLALLQIANAPQHWFHFWVALSGIPQLTSFDGHAPVSAITFYRVVFPFLVLGMLVAVPAVWGMRQEKMRRPRKFRIVLVLAASVSVLTMLFRIPPGLGFLLGSYSGEWVSKTMRVSLLLAYWPVLYMLIKFIFKRSRVALA